MIRILIVDDQKTVRETMKSVLEEEPNFKIIGVATNGLEGIKLATTLLPDVVLMDLEMPYMDGLVATALIYQQNPEINTIILTVQDTPNLYVKALHAGAKGYLLKGSDLPEIANQINLIHYQNVQTKQHNKLDEILPVNHNGHKKLRMIETEVAPEVLTVDHKTNQNNTILQAEPQQLQTDFVTTPKNKLDLFFLLSILKRRYPPALMGFLGVLLGAIIYLLFAQKTYQSTASIILEDRQESISDLGKNLSNTPNNKEYSSLASQANLIKSKLVLQKALDNLTQEQKSYLSEDISPEEIKDHLDVVVIPNTNILEVNYEHPNPELSAAILNQVINASIARNAEIIQSEASSVREFLEKEVRKQQWRLSQTETEENRYRQEQGIVDLDNQTQGLVGSLSNINTQEQELLAQITEQEEKVNSLQKITKARDAQSAYSRGIIGQNEQLKKLRTQLTDIEEQLANARSEFTDENPRVIALLEQKTQIAELYRQQVNELVGEDLNLSPLESTTRNDINQEVIGQLITAQAQLDADREKLKVIRTEKEKLAARISSLPDNVQPLTALVRQREQANESLQFLLRQLEEARIAEAQLVSNLQIVELASPPRSPSSPKTSLTLVIAGSVGIILATGIILLLETIDRTLYEGTEVEQQLQIPLLTNLPHLPSSNNNLIQIKSFLDNQDLYEPYRALLKRLESCSQQKSQVIVVTSAIAEEGKSVVASHLAAVSAMLSKRTLIIDAHLQHPTQHNSFDVQLQPGLTESVADRLKLRKIVQPTKISNLSVVAAGKSSSDSCTIIESPEIESIIKEATKQYDVVIIDAPSVSSNCDAYTLSKYSDGLVMVTRPLHTNTNVLEQRVLELKRNQAAILGFVINNADSRKKALNSDRHNVKQKLPLLLDASSTDPSQPEEETSQL